MLTISQIYTKLFAFNKWTQKPQTNKIQMHTNEKIMEMARNWKPPQKKIPGRKSKLEPYIETFRYMRSARHLTYKEIHSFVLDAGIKVSYPTFIHFMKKNTNKKK